VKDIHKTYNTGTVQVKALRGIHLTVHMGEMVGSDAYMMNELKKSLDIKPIKW